MEDYGISSKEDLEDLTRVQKNKIKIAAEEAAMEITKLRDSIQSPDVTDVESLLSELNLTSVKQEQQYDMSAWEGKIDKVIDMTKEFALKEGDSVLYSEPIAKEFFDDAKEVIESAIKQGRLEPTEENIKIMSEELRNRITSYNVCYTKLLRDQYTAPDTSVLYHDDDPALTPIRLSLPSPPRFEMIDGYGLPAKDQFFKRHNYPDKLKRLEEVSMDEVKEKADSDSSYTATIYKVQERFWSILSSKREYYEEEVEWIQKTWWHIINGYWFFNNGKRNNFV